VRNFSTARESAALTTRATILEGQSPTLICCEIRRMAEAAAGTPIPRKTNSAASMASADALSVVIRSLNTGDLYYAERYLHKRTSGPWAPVTGSVFGNLTSGIVLSARA